MDSTTIQQRLLTRPPTHPPAPSLASTRSHSGVGARRVRETFDRLRNAAPAILFIDEFDAMGAARGAQASGDESASIINELLVGPLGGGWPGGGDG